MFLGDCVGLCVGAYNVGLKKEDVSVPYIATEIPSVPFVSKKHPFWRCVRFRDFLVQRRSSVRGDS